MVPYLPPEIIIEILSRLPVRDRARLQCVCKSWCASISHLSLERSPILLVCQHECGGKTVRFSSYDIAGTLVKEFDHTFKDIMSMNSAVTSSDIVCLKDVHGGVFLCNPTTHQVIALPKQHFYFSIASLGFGYVPSTKELKVLCISNKNDYYSHSAVFTVGSEKSWRKVKDPPFRLFDHRNFAFVKGTIYLLSETYRRNVNEFLPVASFDLEQEEWGQVVLPPVGYFRDIAVRELRGCLSIASLFGHKLNIWLMKELEWEHEYSLDLPCLLINEFSVYTKIGPLTLDDDGRLLLLLNVKMDLSGVNVVRVKFNSGGVIDAKVLATADYCTTSFYHESYLPFRKRGRFGTQHFNLGSPLKVSKRRRCTLFL